MSLQGQELRNRQGKATAITASGRSADAGVIETEEVGRELKAASRASALGVEGNTTVG